MKLVKEIILALLGGIMYVCLELLVRGRTHWTMFLLGGLCFVLIGEINEHFEWSTPLIEQGAIGALTVTCLEFVFGLILNIYLEWNVWDYSNIPFNFLGQICLPFSILWFFVSILAVIIDDYLRYWIFNEEKPKYKLL